MESPFLASLGTRRLVSGDNLGFQPHLGYLSQWSGFLKKLDLSRFERLNINEIALIVLQDRRYAKILPYTTSRRVVPRPRFRFTLNEILNIFPWPGPGLEIIYFLLQYGLDRDVNRNGKCQRPQRHLSFLAGK